MKREQPCLEEMVYEQVLDVPALNIPELKETLCLRKRDDPYAYIVACEPVSRYNGPCVLCGSHGVYSHGYTKDRIAHDISMGKIRIDLNVKVPRYKCTQCGKTFAHPFKSLRPNHQFTERLYEQIKDEALNFPFASVAVRYLDSFLNHIICAE